ncbi:ATP-binding protein (plasmid) [Streptomyces sp. SDT5-1]|uniref:ATP-binding protein n=1 Tax=Streptomyces sp. SDT5-1 TaxID=3406418 RepID=UPI003FD31721
MSSFMDVGVTAVPCALALAGFTTAWRSRRSAERDQRTLAAERADHARQLAEIEASLRGFARDGVPMLRPGQEPALPVPHTLADTGVAREFTALAEALAEAIHREWEAGQQNTEAAVAEVRQVADTTAETATRTAVHHLSQLLLATLSRLNKEVSASFRLPVDDETHAALLNIDRRVQQLLLQVQNYKILSGGKLTRRWPETNLGEVIRASLGPLDQFTRVQQAGTADVAVAATAVGPVMQALSLLIDNALRWSEPTARVEVGLVKGSHGVTVVIDDTGLQMDADQLAAARRILNGEQPTRLTDLQPHAKLGFPVVAALCSGYGFTADVTSPSPRGEGTRATLFIPRKYVTDVAPTPEPVPAPVAAPKRATTANGLAIRTPRSRPAAPAPAEAAAVTGAKAGRPSVAAAWAAGIRQAPDTDPVIE